MVPVPMLRPHPLGGALTWTAVGAFLAIGLALLGLIRTTVILAPTAIQPELGDAYIARIGPRALVLAIAGDDQMAAWQGGAILTEDGHPLGPGQQLHQTIRDRGDGRFAVDKSYIRFSASDNSDPRDNGRIYRLDIPLVPGLLIWGFAAVGTAFGLVRLMAGRTSLLPAASQRRWQPVPAIALAMATGFAASVATCAAIGPVRLSLQSSQLRALAGIVCGLTLLLLLAWPFSWRRFALGTAPHRIRVATIGAVALAPFLLVRVVAFGGLAAAALYAGSSIVALMQGWALPITAAMRWSPLAYRLAEYEPLFGFALLTLAALGTAAGWVALLSQEVRRAVQQQEAALGPLVFPVCLVLITSALVFSLGAMWSGIPAAGKQESASIGGLIPFSDAGGYVAGAYDVAETGVSNIFSLRRPFAAAFRTVLLAFGGFSYPAMLLLQTCLVAALSCIAARAIIRWRGLWAGVGFLGLTYTYLRSFTPTALTESLGACWALLAIPFFIEAIRRRSLPLALLALGATTSGLMTRMGAMFSIPALVLWIGWFFGRTWKERAIAAGAGILVALAVFAFNLALARTYGSGSDVSGDNFSYVLCGLTIGTTWDGCPAEVEKAGVHMPADESAAARLMYETAWKHFQQDPTVFANRLINAAESFVLNLPGLMFEGYAQQTPDPSPKLRALITLVCIVGLGVLLVRVRDTSEIGLWALLWASTIGSAALVYFDDGDRVLAVSYVLLFAFFSFGFADPRSCEPEKNSSRPATRRLSAAGLACFVVMASFFLVVPWGAFRIAPDRGDVAESARPSSGVRLVWGGRRMTGFLIVADKAPLRHDIPTLHLSNFSRIVKASGVEIYQGLVTPQPPATPFGFVFAPEVKKPTRGVSYIVPAQVLERTNVQVWRFDIEEWGGRKANGEYWYYVRRAVPVLGLGTEAAQ